MTKNEAQKELSRIIPLEYLTRDEAAYFLRCSVRKINELLSKGIIKPHKFGKMKSSKVLIKIHDLRQYVESMGETRTRSVHKSSKIRVWAISSIGRASDS